MLATNPDERSRVESGKQVEKQILDLLRARGHKIEDPSPAEDMHSKIDGWWVSKKGNQKFPVQIKFRETGDDILFELIRNLQGNKPGRDLVSQAVLYLVVNRQGTTRLFLTKPIKDKANTLLQQVQKDMETDPFKTKWLGTGWEARVQYDRASGVRKVVAYFNPNMFDTLGTWQLQLE